MRKHDCTILVADDDRFIQDDLAEILAREGYIVIRASTGAETWKQIEQHKPELVLLDLKFPDSNDLQLLGRIRREAPETEVVIVSSQTENITRVVEAIKLGAHDFIPKPVVPDELLNRVKKALELQRLRRSQAHLISEMQRREGFDVLIGDSPQMQQSREIIRKLANADGCVLVRGESGTGKELAARAIHFLSKRRENPFIVVNCAAIPEQLIESTFFGHRKGAFTGAIESTRGKFELAADGTLFLDEIGDMPMQQQAALLRVLEYRKFTPVGDSKELSCRARFVLATNRDLRQAVNDGNFREDLFYRINVATVLMAPLRSRPEDVPILAGYYVQRLCTEMGRAPMFISEEANKLMQNYDWPGNVRELRNVIEAAVMLQNPGQTELGAQDLPAEIHASAKTTAGELSPAERREKQELFRALKQAEGNQSMAAKILNCHRNTVRARIRYYSLSEFGSE
jgi:DNA-binding NtrC family response regulator